MKTKALSRLQETAVTIKQVNTALKNKGHKGELVKGRGYFYFIGEEPDDWHSPSVYVYSLNQLTLPQWIEEYEAKKLENDKGHQDKLNADRYQRKK